MTANVVTVTGTLGPACDGALATFSPNGFGGLYFTDQDGLLQVTLAAAEPAVVVATCDSTGAFSVSLVATDNASADAGPLPRAWTWGLAVTTPATSPPAGLGPNLLLYSVSSFLVSFAHGATQDLSAILPASISPVGFPATLAAETTAREAADALLAPLDTGSSTTAYVTHDDAGWS